MSATAVKDFIRRLLNKMLPKTDFEKKLNVKIATSNIMDNAINIRRIGSACADRI